MSSWFLDAVPDLLWIVISCVVFYFITIITTRLVGLRSFTTFSSFDFLITLAMGALLATTVVSHEVALAEGFTALVSLYLLQIATAIIRSRWGWTKKWLDNAPMLLMENGKVLHDNLRMARITEEELRAKLRFNNVYCYEQVRAVVLESSGEISVLHDTPNQNISFDASLLEGVIRED